MTSLHSRLLQVYWTCQLRLSEGLDTYWSDHCRHTTFETELKTSTFQLLNLKNNCKRLMTSILPCVMSWDVQKTSNLDGYGDYFGRYERANGRLEDMEVSDEINACSVEIEVDVNGVKEPWLLMFKNETHKPPN